MGFNFSDLSFKSFAVSMIFGLMLVHFNVLLFQGICVFYFWLVADGRILSVSYGNVLVVDDEDGSDSCGCGHDGGQRGVGDGGGARLCGGFRTCTLWWRTCTHRLPTC